MKLPNHEQAIVDIDKLTEYCLNPLHPRGRNKARVFEAALGLTIEDATRLRNILLEIAHTNDAQPGESNEYGDRYMIDFEMGDSPKRATVRSTWIVRKGEDVPRLTSCYVL